MTFFSQFCNDQPKVQTEPTQEASCWKRAAHRFLGSEFTKAELIDFLSNREIIFYFKYTYSTLHGIFNFRKLNSA